MDGTHIDVQFSPYQSVDHFEKNEEEWSIINVLEKFYPKPESTLNQQKQKDNCVIS